MTPAEPQDRTLSPREPSVAPAPVPSATERREAYADELDCWLPASASFAAGNIVDAVLALADAELAALAADRGAQIEALQAEVERATDRLTLLLGTVMRTKDRQIRRAESRARAAEGALRQVREAGERLADEWDPPVTTELLQQGYQWDEDMADLANDLRAVLASVPDETTQPATTDEACGCDFCVGIHPGILDHCLNLTRPASPVVAPSATDEEGAGRAGWDRCKTCGYGGWYGSRWHNPPYGAHYHCDNDEHAAKCQPCSIGDGFHRSSPHKPAEHDACDCTPAPVSGGADEAHTQDGDKR